MFRVIAHRFGDPADVLVCEPAARPLAPPDGVVARLLASPINPSDLVTISGAYPHRTSLPFIPGFEALGVVEQAGEATTLSVGQRVLMIGSAGGWQTFKATSDDWCIPVPDDLTDDQAATAYINPLTARMMLSSAAVSAGAVVGVNAANSATGRMLLRMARGRACGRWRWSARARPRCRWPASRPTTCGSTARRFPAWTRRSTPSAARAASPWRWR